MIRGAQFLLLAGTVLVTGCAGAQDVKVRAIANPAAKLGTGAGLLGQARAQLALGNVGLAIEGFRELQREQPENPEVFAGLAACYAAMGRFDVARQNYEFALAYSPDNPALLAGLASSLDRLGEQKQAMQVRAEAARLSAPRPAVQLATQVSPVTPMGVPRAGSITVKVPEAAPAAPRQPEVAIAPVQLASTTANVDRLAGGHAVLNERGLRAEPIPTLSVPAEKPREAAVVFADSAPEASSPDYVDASPTRVAAAAPAPGLKVTSFNLPEYVPVRDATQVPTPSKPNAPEKQVAVLAEARQFEPLPQPDTPVDTGPRLERTSLGEVALITVPRSVEAQVAARARRAQPQPVLASLQEEPSPKPASPVQQALAASSVRWLPLRYASAPQNIQLLNAARTDRLAAKTRLTLRTQGLRNIAIGNARRVRASSLVMYSNSRTPVVRRLAAQFHCRTAKVPGLKAVIVLLGRDAAAQRANAAKA